ncbi:hypothetical protein BU26DRAFT_559693 [Trematosphaeria pertusa]|uniref:Uncharacterized protein n=1 Tax=Trematosphaeria pertusa TaxID=390896 RepID=A0A6A6IYE7_9PLEO|nr:uncharacterized protein BU26DRAFT_559693 [Trematosphaeria pertusa]KAF2255067.1 hypothetical protein BU26DRAFT_559693 [Trematosphaeria pertusa]
MVYSSIQHFLLALSGAALIAANPAPLSPVDISAIGSPITPILPKRDAPDLAPNIGSIYMCKEKNWAGQCAYFKSAIDECWNFVDDWTNTISSFGPDKAENVFFNFNCTLFADQGCVGKSKTLAYPGSADLSTGGAIMDNEAESWKCSYLRGGA